MIDIKRPDRAKGGLVWREGGKLTVKTVNRDDHRSIKWAQVEVQTGGKGAKIQMISARPRARGSVDPRAAQRSRSAIGISPAADFQCTASEFAAAGKRTLCAPPDLAAWHLTANVRDTWKQD